jgi:tetratricopeptide (TPR) repeat protein
MSTAPLKYNPGLTRDEERVKAFVVRLRDLDWVLELISSNTTLQANQHVLIVGPRGSGKTTLVWRVAAGVKSDPSLSRSWCPIVFSEETYSVSSPGEFWLEAILQIYNSTGDNKWKQTRDALSKESDDAVVRESALGQVLEYADHLGKKLILIVENLNMLLAQLQANSDWELRHTLLNESRIMLLGTATTKFSELENVDRAWYELFTTHELKPLNTKDSLALWKSYTGTKAPPRQVQALRILTGGNPRLFRILSDFVINASFRELMDNLTRLIDEHTEYFKGSLDNLAPMERKVFVALLERWDPSDARQVAADARLDVNKTSALLLRLVEKARVATIPALGRKRRYQVAERMFNIYYLMRRRGRPADRVRAFVRFMVQFYREESLVDMIAGIAREACLLGPDQRHDHYSAYAEVFSCGLGSRVCSKILRRTQPEFFQDQHAPRTVRRFAEIANLPDVTAIPEAVELIQRAIELRPDDSELRVLGERVAEQRSDSERTFFSESPRNVSDAVRLWNWLAEKFHSVGLFEDAFVATEKSIAKDPANAVAWGSRGELLWFHLRKNHEEEKAVSMEREAEAALRRAVELDPSTAWYHGVLATILRCRENITEAEKEITKALQLDKNSETIWSEFGAVKLRQHRFPEAEDAFRQALKIDSENAFIWGEFGLLLAHDDKRTAEAIAAYQRALRIHETDWFAWTKLVELKARTGTKEEALSTAEEFLRKFKHNPMAVIHAAWAIHLVERPELLPHAIEWVRAAATAFPDDWKLSHTHAALLAKVGDWKNAIAAMPNAIMACANSESALKRSTDFLIAAAANGNGSEVLALLERHGKSAVLEPLAVGVQIYLGGHPIVAQEVLDVGEDVAKRIREFKRESEQNADRSPHLALTN